MFSITTRCTNSTQGPVHQPNVLCPHTPHHPHTHTLSASLFNTHTPAFCLCLSHLHPHTISLSFSLFYTETHTHTHSPVHGRDERGTDRAAPPAITPAQFITPLSVRVQLTPAKEIETSQSFITRELPMSPSLSVTSTQLSCHLGWGRGAVASPWLGWNRSCGCLSLSVSSTQLSCQSGWGERRRRPLAGSLCGASRLRGHREGVFVGMDMKGRFLCSHGHVGEGKEKQ